jgi:RHS repeat-associated protein
VNVSYSYDNDSRVTGITYKFNANTLGDLSHTYDSLGRRTQVNGSFAQTGLPGAITSATYDAANELTNWNGTSISYDLNGNMLSDGTNAFTWNARNQVATLNSVSLQYDGFGRRTKNLQNTSFLFDGANAVQELSGSTALANLLNGGIDEVFTRADSTGVFTPLKDAHGSTIALVDGSGNLATTYGYDPFGNTTVSGAASANASQYTGRENEGNGLYFYRARYYSPLLGRFISEDPLGFAGDQNFYRYAGNAPVNFLDPFGNYKCQNSDECKAMGIRMYLPNGELNPDYGGSPYSGVKDPGDIGPWYYKSIRYGNWCGPNWSGGWWNSQHNWEMGYAAPIDNLDAACRVHDIVYDKYGITADDPSENCDKTLDKVSQKKCEIKHSIDVWLHNRAVDEPVIGGTSWKGGLHHDYYKWAVEMAFPSR